MPPSYCVYRQPSTYVGTPRNDQKDVNLGIKWLMAALGANCSLDTRKKRIWLSFQAQQVQRRVRKYVEGYTVSRKGI
jgi:hypothetical protein